MEPDYFPNRELECYSSALANLFVEMGDRPTAQTVFENYRGHRLVSERGNLHLGLATRVLLDLTNKRYSGTLYVNMSGEYLKEATGICFANRSDEILEIIKEEMENGRIIDNQDPVNYTRPALFIVGVGNMGHWVVDLGGGSFIDNGHKKSYIPSTLDLYGILDVKRL